VLIGATTGRTLPVTLRTLREPDVESPVDTMNNSNGLGSSSEKLLSNDDKVDHAWPKYVRNLSETCPEYGWNTAKSLLLLLLFLLLLLLLLLPWLLPSLAREFLAHVCFRCCHVFLLLQALASGFFCPVLQVLPGPV